MSAHQNLRLRVLLAWAIDFVEQETDCLERSYIDHRDGRIHDVDVLEEVTDARRWLKEAREAMKNDDRAKGASA